MKNNEEQKNKPPQPTIEERIARIKEFTPKEFFLRYEAMKRAIKKNDRNQQPEAK